MFYSAIGEYVDLIAERIVQLGGIAEDTVRTSAGRSRLTEYPLTIADGTAHVAAVMAALTAFGQEIRATIAEAETIGDAGSADLCTEVTRGTGKWLWFVEAHIRSPA